jgi:eukaryotic-like serine/threonine-protein kinase
VSRRIERVAVKSPVTMGRRRSGARSYKRALQFFPMDVTLSAPIGQLLDGRYLVESQIARGGMATVYQARDVRLERTVALKIAHPELASDREFVARFIGEARAVARLSSPYVVGVFDQGSTGDLHYIAMEYVPGPTLRELLNARGRLSPREALDIIERVLTGLAAAHDAGIIHRDVKPENVLLGNGTSVKVADFGLARAAASVRHTKTGLLIGTAAYLAPEQVASNLSDQRTDVYSSGVMLFEMLTGVQPHTGESPLAVAYKHVNSVVPAPSSLLPDLPAALDTLVALGTGRDPDLRPPDARHYLRAISEVRRGMPVPTLPRRGHLPAEENGHQVPAGGPPGSNGRPGGETHSYDTNGDWAGEHEPGALAAPDVGALAAAGFGLDPAAGPRFGGPESSTRALSEWGQTGPLGQAGAPGDEFGAGGSAHHTMIVPAGPDSDFGDRAYPARRHSRPRRGYAEPWLQRWLFSRRILILVAIIVIALGAWWFAAGQYFSVPSVAGKSMSMGRADLTNAGLAVSIGTARHSNTVPAGEIISTTPGAGTRTTHGSAITIIPSLGPVLVSMPPVTGQPAAQAKQALKAAGLRFQISSQTSASIPAGIVISTQPTAYQHWPVNKQVQLVISAGPPLPNFVGQQVSVAQQAASAGGYSINSVTATGSTEPPGTVVKQSPAAGTPISSQEVVTVYVSQGAAMVGIPNVQGMNASQATTVLTQAGFKVSEDDLGFGQRVISYSPTGSAPQGSTITLVVGFSF